MKIKSVLKSKHVAWVSGVLLAAILGIAVSRSAARPSAKTSSSPVVEVAPVEQRDIPIYETGPRQMNGREKIASGVIDPRQLSQIDFDLSVWAQRKAPGVLCFGHPRAL